MAQLLIPQQWQLSAHMKPFGPQGSWKFSFRGYEYHVTETADNRFCFTCDWNSIPRLAFTISSVIHFQDTLYALVTELHRELVHSMWHVYIEDSDTLRVEADSGHLVLTEQDDRVVIFGQIPSCRRVVSAYFQIVCESCSSYPITVPGL